MKARHFWTRAILAGTATAWLTTSALAQEPRSRSARTDRSQTLKIETASILDLKDRVPKDYAVIEQIVPTPPHAVPIMVVAEPPWDPQNGTWKVKEPIDKDLVQELTSKWSIQASCHNGLETLEVTGPGGIQQETDLEQKFIQGTFTAQSFTLDTVKDLCTDWATGNNCDPKDPDCPQWELFELEGGTPPASSADRLRLRVTCQGGEEIADKYYLPVLSVRCISQL